MIYTDLNKIPLSRFTDVFFGNYKALVITGEHRIEELSSVAHKMIYEYMSIVGGRQVMAEIARKNEELNLLIKIECMTACGNLTKIDRYSDACLMLDGLGYKLQEKEREKIKIRIASVLSNSQYRLDMIKNSANNSVSKYKVDGMQFVRERVIVMQHYKMHIDPSVFTAGEYAYMVKGMCEDIERMSKKR